MPLIDMTTHQKIFAVLTSSAVFIFILELLRRRRLKEEYSWLWILTGITMIIMVIWYTPLVIISKLIGAVSPVTTLFIFAILFLLVLSIHYSIIISRLTHQVKDLTQEMSILKSEIKETIDDR
ncbi:hypothetical protein BMS3Abin10_01686 [bacterium BMS3Abin10]|nr:hypothetical protein BMS3Abin10_01686 [bacterium BMS3Abin10]GBE39167.1 hypothetical protein BMS3Bbin08_01787 [bacterium BMS3Bbin08]